MRNGTPAGQPARVLYLHTTSEIGGSDVSLTRLVEHLDRTRFDPMVVLPSDGPLVPRLRQAGADVTVMPTLWKLTSRRGRLFLARFAAHYPFAIRELARFIRDRRADIVHTNTIHNLYGGAASARAHVPHVWHVREIVWQSHALKAIEVALARRWSTRIVVTSDAVAAMFDGLGGRPGQLVKISNGVETGTFRPGDGSAVRAQLGVAPGDTLFGIVGRLDEWKGVDVFLDAAAQVARDRPRAQFAVVGGPIIGLERYAARVEAHARALGLDARVRFTGWRFAPHDMPDVHRALDVLVLASTEPEPFGLSVVEAMSTGKPVIATRHGGPTELVVDGVTGWLVPPRDGRALAAAMTRLIDDPPSMARMGEEGRKRAVALYDAKRYVDDIQQLYADILSSAPAAASQ